MQSIKSDAMRLLFWRHPYPGFAGAWLHIIITSIYVNPRLGSSEVFNFLKERFSTLATANKRSEL
jgi:hypothetical protein